MKESLVKINLSVSSPGWDFINGLIGILAEPISPDKDYAHKVILLSKNFRFEKFYLLRSDFNIL